MEWPENIGVGKPYNPDSRINDYLLAYCSGELGVTQEKEAYLNGIVEYTNKHFQVSSPNNLVGLLAMRETAPNDAQDVLEKLKASGSDSDLVQWIIASYTNDQPTIDQLVRKEENKKFVESLQFEILTKVVKLSNATK